MTCRISSGTAAAPARTTGSSGLPSTRRSLTCNVCGLRTALLHVLTLPVLTTPMLLPLQLAVSMVAVLWNVSGTRLQSV